MANKPISRVASPNLRKVRHLEQPLEACDCQGHQLNPSGACKIDLIDRFACLQTQGYLPKQGIDAITLYACGAAGVG